jgi:small subunit ribosomal protein S1
MSKGFEELFEESLTSVDMKIGSILEAEVIKIEDEYVLIDSGLKSESWLQIRQFQDVNGELTVKVGDKVLVALSAVEDSFGETRLSRDKAKRAEVWLELEAAFKDNETVTGRVIGKVKGGLTVDINSVKAFLPGSLIDVRPMREFPIDIDDTVDVKIVKMDDKFNNVVVSRKAIIEESTSGEREELLASLQEGQVIKGYVKNLTDYGVFIDLGGVDGLLHITDMSWRRIRHPKELLNIGDEVQVKILKFDPEKQRVSLGLKQMSEDPWVDANSNVVVGNKVKGTVTSVADYGCFIDLGNGLEGLVHVSEMDWTNKNINPHKLVEVGQELEVKVLEIDQERRRVSLGIKQCAENPWQDFSMKYSTGDKVKGVIKSTTDFGLFVELTGSIDGLIHLSDLSWNQPGENTIKDYKQGDEVEAVVLSIDSERERISLGLKQLENDPFSTYVDMEDKNKPLLAKVTNVNEKGVEVELADGAKGYIRTSELSVDKVADPRNQFNVGDELEAKFIGVDRKNSKLNLSVRAMHEKEEKDVKAKKPSRKAEKAKEPSVKTLGDLIKEKMTKETKAKAEKPAARAKTEKKADKKEESEDKPKAAAKAKKADAKDDSESEAKKPAKAKKTEKSEEAGKAAKPEDKADKDKKDEADS